MLKGGPGVPVVVCNGFLSDKGKGWAEWKSLVTKRYPDSPVYRIHWGAKELKDLGILASMGGLKVAGPAAIKQAALAATKKGASKLGPLGPFLLGAELAKNPWHVARSRADKTGAIIADVLARTEGPTWVLVGHSLGARVMAVAAQALGTKPDGPRLQAVHLTGAAIAAKCDPQEMTAAVDDAIYNYHSTNDIVLKYLYSAAEGGRVSAGGTGFTPAAGKLINVDVSADIKSHSDYYSKFNLL
jgi:pimeloyl-ACP methyl ester carboxylesterase